MDIQKHVDDAVDSGGGDWVMLSDIAHNIRIRLDPRDEAIVRERTMAVAERLLMEGLMEAGETPGGVGFVPWGLSPRDALKRITKEWDELGRPVRMGDTCWLRLTPKGELRSAEFDRRRASGEDVYPH